jgi:hypothetical protein
MVVVVVEVVEVMCVVWDLSGRERDGRGRRRRRSDAYGRGIVIFIVSSFSAAAAQWW